MANININEISQNYTYNIGNSSYACVALPITSSWGPGYEYDSSTGIDLTSEKIENSVWNRFPANQEGLESFVSTYRGPATHYLGRKDFSYQQAMTLLTAGYDLLVCRLAGGNKASGKIIFKDGNAQKPFAVKAKYCGTFGNNLAVNIRKIKRYKSLYWNVITYIVDSTTSSRIAVENLNFVFDLESSSDTILHISEVESAFLEFDVANAPVYDDVELWTEFDKDDPTHMWDSIYEIQSLQLTGGTDHPEVTDEINAEIQEALNEALAKKQVADDALVVANDAKQVALDAKAASDAALADSNIKKDASLAAKEDATAAKNEMNEAKAEMDQATAASETAQAAAQTAEEAKDAAETHKVEVEENPDSTEEQIAEATQAYNEALAAWEEAEADAAAAAELATEKVAEHAVKSELYQTKKTAYEEAKAAYEEAKAAYEDLRDAYLVDKQVYEDAKAVYEAAKVEYETAKAVYEAKRDAYDTKLIQAYMEHALECAMNRYSYSICNQSYQDADSEKKHQIEEFGYIGLLGDKAETITDKNSAAIICKREWMFNAAYAVLNALNDKLAYNPNRIIVPGWDDQDLLFLEPTLFADGENRVYYVDTVSPLHQKLMDVAYYSRCATAYIDIPRSLEKYEVYNEVDASEESTGDRKKIPGYAQKLARLNESLNLSTVNGAFYSSHSALFAPWGRYIYVGTGKQMQASPSFLALMIDRAMIKNQTSQYEWQLPTNRRNNLRIGKLDYVISKKYLDIWQSLEGVGVNCITRIPDIGLSIWGNSTLYEVPPATYQALANLSTRKLVNAVEDLAYRCGISITFNYNNDQAYNAFYAGMTPLLDTMRNVGAITDYYLRMAEDVNGLDQVNANSVVGKIYLVIDGVINDINIDLIALPPQTSLDEFRA